MLDAGHGGSDSGAIGRIFHEKYITLIITLFLKDILKSRGFDVYLTRQDDTHVSLSERCKKANDIKADAFISIHCNASEATSAKGMEVWTSPGQTSSDKLATCIGESLKVRFPNHSFRTDYCDKDLDKESGFTVLVDTKMSAVLIECEFITNPTQEKFLANRNNQSYLALAIADGIGQYYV